MTEPSLEVLLAQYELQVPVTVGRATIAWNTISQSVFELYQTLSEFDEASAKATFFIVASDRSQRDMLSQLVNTRLKQHSPKIAKKVQSVLGDINKLSGRRNDVLHVVFLNQDNPRDVKQFHERGHLKGKKGQELIEAIHELTLDCLDKCLDLIELRGQVLELPHYRNKSLAIALQQYISRTEPATMASQSGFGLLGNLPTILQSAEEDRD